MLFMTATAQPALPDFAAARFHMIESQIRPNKVRNERLLEAMGDLPREIFVPQPLAGIAYIDEDMAVAAGRYLLQPMVLARFLEEANVKPDHRVLDVAPATGYSTALLAQVAKYVTAVESDPLLAQQAGANLARLDIKNAALQQGAPAEGWRDAAPYDLIVVNGSARVLPEALTAQLAEGGKLLIVIREFGPARIAHQGEARLYEKIRGSLSHRALFDANVKLLPGFDTKPAFTF
jgi:protein-L-isoaspartate(D-aspartate) O-methyltransferase